MKRVFQWTRYVLLSFIILTVTTLLFLLNSTKTIQWAADTYAPQYGFAYKQISGSLLTGLEIKELTFKDEILLDSLKVEWNPATILYNKVSITYLEASGLNVENIKKVVENFTSREPKEDSNAFIFSSSIGVRELHLVVNPFEESGIGFKDISLDGKGIVYYGEGIDVNDLFLSIDTNVTSLQLSGGIQEKKIRVKKFSILNIDTMAFQNVIEKMIATKIHEEIVEYVEPEIEQYKTGKDNFIPKSVHVDSTIVSVKPAEYSQVRLSQGEMNITSVKVDIHKIIDLHSDTVQVGALSLLVDTNLSRLSMHSKLQDETITVESLSLRDIDTIALRKLFLSIKNNQATKVEPKVSHEDETIDNNSTVNPLLPKFLYLKQLDSSIKSATYDPVFIKSAEVNATNIKLNIGTLTAESGELDVTAMSSFAALIQHGVIKDNHIESKGHITPLKDLFETYDLPLKEDVFGNIPLNISVNEKQLVIDMDIKGEEILQVKEGEFNVEHLSLKNHITYLIPESKLTVENEGNISIPYIKDIRLENVLTLEDGVLDYKGKIEPGTEGIDANYAKPLNDLKVTYQGNTKSIKALIDSEGLEGKFVSDDFKKGDLTLSAKQPLVLRNMVSLPKVLHSSQVAMDIHVPLDFTNLTPLNAKAKIRSNLANIDADLFYDKELKITAKTIFPEDSLLREFSPKLNLDALSPLETDLTMVEKALYVDIRSKGLTSKVKFNPKNKDLNGDLVLGGAKFVFKGNMEKKLSLENSVSSLENLLKQISKIYIFEVPPLDGDAKISLVLTGMKDIELKLSSNTLIYKADKKTEHILKDTMISLGFADSILTLNKYHTNFQEQKIFAIKPSVITMKEGNIDISPLWVNDELKVTGRYNIENKKGEILASADPLNVSHEMVDLASRIDIKTRLEGASTDIKGTVTILGGNIYYDMDTKTFASDSDIINVQELKKEKSTPFMDNLIASIKVNTEKPFNYKTADADIKAKADLVIDKAHKGTVQVLGMIEILKGSSYSFENKNFVFKKSIIAFTGDPNKPILDIAAIYNSVKAEITIQVTGSHTAPNIILSSTPRMSRQEILSVLLFGSVEAAGENSEEDMGKIMGGTIGNSLLTSAGGAMVQSVLSSVGINIDNLPFIGQSNDANRSKKSFLSWFSNDEEEVVIPTHEIRFTGQKYLAEKDIQKAMGVDTKNIFQFWKEDKPSIDDTLLPTLEESLRNFYDSEGFYDAKFSIKTSKTDVAVNIEANEPVKIHDINIKSDYDISDLITFEKGKIFRAKEFVSVKNKIIQKLLKKGYCSYDLDSKAYVDLDTHEVSVLLTLKKGGVCTFGKVTVHRLETIDDSVVISRVRAREGERFSTERIAESYEALYDLDAFDSVLVNYDRKFYNVVPIDIVGSEITKPWYLKIGAIYDADVGVRLSTEVIRTNFMGNAKKIHLDLAYSSIEQLADISYFVPALFNISNCYIDITSKIGYSNFEYTGFEEEQTYAQAFLSYTDEKWSVYAGFSLENINISLFDKYKSIQEVEEGTFLLAGPFLSFSYDARDSKFDPKYGYFIEGKVEYSLPYDEEASSYLRYTLEGRAIHTFSDLTLSAVAKAGSVDQIQNEIPESKLFFAGGANSNRAYGYKRVGVILSPTSYGIAGGSSMLNLSLEANYPIWEALHGAVFTDNTMLANDKFDFTGDVLSSAGLGVRYKTPIGPLKIDVGMNVRDTSQYGVQFQIGQSF